MRICPLREAKSSPRDGGLDHIGLGAKAVHTAGGACPNCVESDALASDSKNFLPPKSGPESGPESSPDSASEPAPAPDYENQHDRAASGLEPRAEDKELLEMLEQLSETIDTAHNVLAGQHDFAAGALNAAPPVASEFLPPPPPTPPAKPSNILPILAASAGVLLGVGALAAFWLLWKSPPAQDAGKPARAQGRVVETFVSPVPARKSMTQHMNTPPAAPPEPKTASQPASAPKPSPAHASLAPAAEAEPPGDEPAAMSEPAALSAKKPEELAAIPQQKEFGLPPLAEDEEGQLLRRGKALTATGDISAARLAYEYAARRKSVEAMFALAQTYDPEMLAAWSVVGIQPDMGAALNWYGRAAKLGHEQAGTRKRELEQLIGR